MVQGRYLKPAYTMGVQVVECDQLHREVRLLQGDVMLALAAVVYYA